MRRALAALVLLAACATPAAERGRPLAAPYRPQEVREPAVFVRVASGPDLQERARLALAETYEAALVTGLDGRGVAVRDFRRIGPDERLTARAALARAREVGAGHAVVVEVQFVARTDRVFCRESRRPFRAFTAVLAQAVQVLRTRDDASLLVVDAGGSLDVMDLDPDCGAPRDSPRRDTAELVSAAADVLLGRVLGR